MPVLGHVGHAGVETLAGRGVRYILAGDGYAAALGVAQARYGLHQLGLAVPLHAGQGYDLAGAHLEVDAVDGDQVAVVGDGRSFSWSTTSPGTAGPLPP